VIRWASGQAPLGNAVLGRNSPLDPGRRPAVVRVDHVHRVGTCQASHTKV